MTTTDTDALTESIAWALTEHWDRKHSTLLTSVPCSGCSRVAANAVLPIVEAEVRAAKVEALREAVEKHAITIPDALGYKVPAVTVEDLLDAATEYETGDQR